MGKAVIWGQFRKNKAKKYRPASAGRYLSAFYKKQMSA
jgi:hypothetical protein